MDLEYVKGTLMQIWKFPFMFESIYRSYLENLAFLILINLELFTRKVFVFSKKSRLILNIFYCFRIL